MNLDDIVLAELDAGNIFPRFQPVVDLATKEVVGYESLCRWVQPDRIVPPMEFLPQLRDSTLQVLALVFARQILANPSRRGWVSLNLSSVVLSDDFIQDLVELVPLADRQYLKLELLEDDKFSVFALNKLAVHFVLLLDDWGTGYNNLIALTGYPIKYLKLNKDLTAGVTNSPVHAQVCRFALRMAHELGMTVIAEGVEAQSQADWLRFNGCQLGQGWYLGAPGDCR